MTTNAIKRTAAFGLLALAAALFACDSAPPLALADDAAGSATFNRSALHAAAAEPDTTALASYRPEDAPNGALVAGVVIGPAGGSVRLADIEIVVPPGAVERPTRFGIRIPPPQANGRAMAEFTPHNQQFAVPVVLRMPHATTDAQAGAPIVWWAGTQWIEQVTTALPDGRIETHVDHFSFYGTALRGITMAGG